MPQEIASQLHRRHLKALTAGANLDRASRACIPAGVIFGFLTIISTVPITGPLREDSPLLDSRAALPYVFAATLLSIAGYFVLRALSRFFAKHVND